MRKLLLSVALILVSLAVSVHAETITRCGGSSGQGWYFAGPHVPRGEAGWNEDAITKGDILLIVDGDEPDIVMTDVAGTRSARAAGAWAMFVPSAKAGFKLVLLVYPAGAVEHYLFQLDSNGNGTVAWGTVKVGGLIQKSSLFVAKCRAP